MASSSWSTAPWHCAQAMLRSACALWGKSRLARGSCSSAHGVAVARLVAEVAVRTLPHCVVPGRHLGGVRVVGRVARVAGRAGGNQRVVRARARRRAPMAALAREPDLFRQMLPVVEAQRDVLHRVDDVARAVVRVGRARGQEPPRDPLVRRKGREPVHRRRRLGERERHDRHDDEQRQQGQEHPHGLPHFPTAMRSHNMRRNRWPESRFMSCSHSNVASPRGRNR